LLEATTMRGLRGTRWRLWLALLATLVLTPCVEASADITPPSVPTGLTASAVSCSQINLGWNASTDTGGSGVWAYNVYVYRNAVWTFLKQVLAPATSTSVTGLSASTLYYYIIAGVDGAGNTSALSSWTSAATVACTATTTTTTLPAGGACSSPTIIPSQGGTFSGVNSGTSTLAGMCGSTGTSPEKVFRWTPAVSGVATIQTCGGGTNFDTALYMRSGSCSSGGEVACNDDACANASGLLRASRITPTVTAGQTYYIVVDGYGGAQGTFALTVTAPGTVTSTTAIASTSTTTTLVSVDRTVPAVPTGLTAAAANCSQINLTWLASTDTGGTGLRGYNVYRGGAFMKQVLAPATSTGDAGLAASTVYSYAVRAVDNAGNASGMSTTVSTNTPTCSVVGTGQLRWAKRRGGTSADNGKAITTDGSGNVLVGGSFTGTVDLGGGALSSGGMDDAFLAKYLADGTPVWSRRMGGTGNDGVTGIAVDRSGNAFVTGYFQNAVDFGGGALSSAGLNDIFVAKYSATNGFLWAKRFGSTGDDEGFGVAVDGNGDVLVTGVYTTSVNFGGSTLSSFGGGRGAFIVKLGGSDGHHIWSQRLLSLSESFGFGVAVDSAGNAYDVGSFIGDVMFKGIRYTNAGDQDVFLAKYAAADGAETWIDHFGGPNTDMGTGVAVDAGNNLVVTGQFNGSVDFGGGTYTSVNNDVFVAKYAGSSGAYIWSKHVTGPGWENATGVAVDSTGNIAVTGNFDNAIDFGGGALSTVGSGDIFVAKLSGASGAQLWARRFGGSTNDSGNAVAIDGSGNVVTTGSFGATVDFGGGPLTSAGGADIFVVDLTP